MRRVSYGDSGGIVSAVFEPFEPVEEDLVGVFAVTRVGEDSAHFPVGLDKRFDMFEQLPLEYLLVEFRCVAADVVGAPTAGFERFDGFVEAFGSLFHEEGSR